MTNLFYLQLITSFLVGGSTIALLSFVAEKANGKIAGILLSLPSTVVVSFIFIAWATSPEAVGKIAPIAVATDGSVMIFSVVYMYVSRIKLPRTQSIILSLSGGLGSWLILSVPLAIYKFDNIILSLLIFGLFVSIAYYFLTIKNNVKEQKVHLAYNTVQKLGRAIFAGSIITLAVFHPFWGGVMSGFPAAFTSTFVILHWYYGSDMLFKIGKTVAAGSFVYVPFVVASHWTFPAFGIFGGTISAYLVSLVVFFALMKLKRK